jgi:hypothetical protein
VYLLAFRGDTTSEDVKLMVISSGSQENAAERVRMKLNLTGEHRDKIDEWLKAAMPGDVLFLPDRLTDSGTDETQEDNHAIVYVGADYTPTVSRLVVRTVVRRETTVSLDKLPVGEKTVKPGDLKKGKNKKR